MATPTEESTKRNNAEESLNASRAVAPGYVGLVERLRASVSGDANPERSSLTRQRSRRINHNFSAKTFLRQMKLSTFRPTPAEVCESGGGRVRDRAKAERA